MKLIPLQVGRSLASVEEPYRSTIEPGGLLRLRLRLAVASFATTVCLPGLKAKPSRLEFVFNLRRYLITSVLL